METQEVPRKWLLIFLLSFFILAPYLLYISHHKEMKGKEILLSPFEVYKEFFYGKL